MNGGHFDYHQFFIREIADKIEEDITRALQPKPEMVHEDYWMIKKCGTPHSFYIYPRYDITFPSYEEAEGEDVLLQSIDEFMAATQDGEQIPILYSIHHAVFDRYP